MLVFLQNNWLAILIIVFIVVMVLSVMKASKLADKRFLDEEEKPDDEITTEERHFHSIDPELYN